MIFKTHKRHQAPTIPHPWVKFESTIFVNKLTGAVLSVNDHGPKEWRFTVVLETPGGTEYDHAFKNLGEALEHMQNFMIESKI